MEQPIQRRLTAQFDCNGTGDKATLAVVGPAKIVRIGLLAQTTDTGDVTVKFDKRILAGSDTGRVSAGIGTVIKASGNKQGKYTYKALSDSGITVDCGDEIIVNVTAENASANAFAVAAVELLEIQEEPANLSDALATA